MGCGASKPPEVADAPEKKEAYAPAATAAAPTAPAPPAATSGKKGYVYGFFDMKDPAEFKNVYSPMAEPTLDPYGGKFVMKHALGERLQIPSPCPSPSLRLSAVEAPAS